MTGEVAILASAIAGLMYKISDSGSKKWIQNLAGVLAGISLAIAAVFPPLTSIVVGAIIGTLLARRAEKTSHHLMAATFFLIYAVTTKEVHVIPMILAGIAAYLDGRLSERGDILGKKILLPMATLILTPLLGLIPVAAVLAHRAGYVTASITYRVKQDFARPSQ